MNQAKWAAGLERCEVQFIRTLSPGWYLGFPPVILGPPSGSAENKEGMLHCCIYLKECYSVGPSSCRFVDTSDINAKFVTSHSSNRETHFCKSYRTYVRVDLCSNLASQAYNCITARKLCY